MMLEYIPDIKTQGRLLSRFFEKSALREMEAITGILKTYIECLGDVE
jgi:hypothetical protein